MIYMCVYVFRTIESINYKIVFIFLHLTSNCYSKYMSRIDCEFLTHICILKS